jgi:phage terminase large subunit
VEFERRVRWYQRAFHEYLVNTPSARAIEVAHRRWGKDEIALGATCELAHKRIGSYWHCLPEYAQGRKALWTAVNAHTGKKRIDEAFPPEIRKRTNDQEMFIELQCGSTWQVIGSDRYNATVGAGVAGIIYSEWALANPSAWAYHRPMLEENNGWAAFITTPRGRNHAYSMYQMAKKSDHWFAEISSVHDTNALTDDQMVESLKEYIALYGEDPGRAQFEQEYLCSFNAAILGAFYAREMLAVRNEGRIRPVVAMPGQPVNTAWDIGVRDDTSIWWFQVYGGRVYILDCYTASGVGVEHYADICHEKPWLRGIDYVPHDAKILEWGSGKTRVETMRQNGLNPQLIPLAKKLDGINAVRRLLPLCVFDPKCEKIGIAALEQYRREWDDNKKCFKASEVHDWTSHLSDAFRYLAMAWRQAPKVEVQAKQPIVKGAVMLPGAPQPKSKTRISV